MDSSVYRKGVQGAKRALRVRRRLRGDAERPRLSLIKSNCHLQAQIIDDEKGVTLGAVSTFSKEFRQAGLDKRNKESAKKLGEKLAEVAKEKNIDKIVFDRGKSKYHGVVAAFADAARESGLQF
jgi:large subunit ribosomal protein L18